MNCPKLKLIALAVALLAGGVTAVHANIRITEVAPWSSGNSPVNADWFELTNMGAAPVDVTGWRVDDSSNAFASSVLLNGIGSIAAGQSVIFIEGTSTVNAGFITTWFGATSPAGLLIGNYSGSGIGLSTSGDAVNIFDTAGALQAKVTFGASPGASPFASFDNAAGLDNTAITQLSVVGVNGAFLAANPELGSIEIGSPGSTVAAIPEPETYALMFAGLGLVGYAVRRRGRRQSSSC